MEATALLAAVSLASSSSCCLPDAMHSNPAFKTGTSTTDAEVYSGGQSIACPVFIPVHDALRDAYWGVLQLPGCSVRFSTDSVHISATCQHLMTLEVRAIGDREGGALAWTCNQACETHTNGLSAVMLS